MLIRFIFVTILAAGILFFHSCSSSKNSSSIDDPDKGYLLAKSKYDKKEYLDAIDDFNLIKMRFSGSNIIDKAIYYLGMSYFKREDYILAIYEFETILKNYPSSKLSEDARYMLAMCYYGLSPEYSLDQTYTRYAISEFQSFLESYPQSSKVTEANKKINKLLTKLALKELKSAEIYFILENYQSALVYYDNILENYFDTPYADDALYGKIQALILMNKNEEAKNEIERFEEKFSTSGLLPKVIALKNKI